MTTAGLKIGAALAFVAAALGAATGEAAAQQRDCGGTYTIVRGDTLARVAGLHYGDARFFRQIHQANLSVIGPDPALIEIGMVLRIPCLDSRGQPVRAELPPLPDAPREPAGAIRFLAASGGSSDPARGAGASWVVAELLTAAMPGVRAGSRHTVTFAEGWVFDPAPMLEETGFDLAFPALRPDCADDDLSAAATRLCDALAWSMPVLEQRFGVHGLAGPATHASWAELDEAAVCVPLGYPAFLLTEAGATARVVAGRDAGACLERLGNGVDVALVADGAADIPPGVMRHEALDLTAPLHIVARPGAATTLERLDAELTEMKADGRWFEIVRRSLLDQRLAAETSR